MSEQAAQAFIERMKSDADFRAKVMAEEDVEARLALIGAEGFDCSAEEIGALQELTEAELGGAVGGGDGTELCIARCWEACGERGKS
jgi:predicted ribosomally synthesized peptide with nif11-like leader